MRAEARKPWRRRPDAPPARVVSPRLTMPEEMVLARRLELLGLSRPARIRVNDNRTVMVSLSRGGVLSIHRGFALAPDRVLKAVVRFLQPRIPRSARRAAERVILAFPAADHAPGGPGRARAPDRPRPGDAEKGERLARLFAEYNRRHFAGVLPSLPMRISGRMRTRLGQLCLHDETGEPHEITVSREHIDRHGWAEAAHTLLHEMVHLWQHVNGHAVDHGPAFRRKAMEVGVVASARRDVRATRHQPGRHGAAL